MNECIFCKIIKKEIPSEIVYEDEKNIAFMDINPVNAGHVLVIPKKHFENIFDIGEEELIETTKIVRKISKAVKDFSEGVNIHQNNGRVAGQLINHTHFHVIPRYNGDGLVSWQGKEYNADVSKNLADKMRENLN